MALQKPDGEYIRVTSAEISTVHIVQYQNADQRQREKDDELTPYETIRPDTRAVKVDLDKNADSSKSIKDNDITAGYEALLTLDEFKDAINA